MLYLSVSSSAQPLVLCSCQPYNRRRKQVRSLPLPLHAFHDDKLKLYAQKCDGTRPTCRQCIAHGRGLDCEYADPYTPTRSELLQEYLARLQRRAESSEENTTPRNARVAAGLLFLRQFLIKRLMTFMLNAFLSSGMLHTCNS